MTVGIAILVIISGWLVASTMVGEAVYRHGSDPGSRVEHYLVGAGIVLAVVAIAGLLALIATVVITMWGVPL